MTAVNHCGISIECTCQKKKKNFLCVNAGQGIGSFHETISIFFFSANPARWLIYDSQYADNM